MSDSMKQRMQSILWLAVFVIAFVGVSALVQEHRALLVEVLHSGGIFGPLSFVLLTVVFVVFVIPLDIVFLIPIGSAVWGPIATAVLSISGWTIGAAIAFGIARYFGSATVGRLVGLSRVRAIESRVPVHHLFWMVVLLRMLVSVDILSYALGLFSRIRFGEYVLATLIGVTPFGFYFSYAGTLPFWYQVTALSAAFLLATAVLLRYGIVREP